MISDNCLLILLILTLILLFVLFIDLIYIYQQCYNYGKCGHQQSDRWRSFQ
jgi:hypothetical protein